MDEVCGSPEAVSGGGRPDAFDTAGADQTDSVHHQLLVAFSHSNRAMMARTRADGLMPGQPKVLEHLLYHDGCNQRSIGQACVMDKSTVTSVLARMEERGLVERRPDPHDRRGLTIWLTDEGRRAAGRVRTYGDEVDALCLSDFDADEREQFKGLLKRVINNFEHARGNH